MRDLIRVAQVVLSVGVGCVEVEEVYPRLGVAAHSGACRNTCNRLIVRIARATSIRLITAARSVIRISPIPIRNVLIMSTPLYFFANSCILGVEGS